MMTKLIQKLMTAAILVSAVATIPAQAADKKVMLPIANAMAENEAQTKLGNEVKFYFSGQPTPEIKEHLGNEKVSLRTNAVGKSDEKSCNWVFLSDMLKLKEHAKKVGANAVINITNNFKDQPNPSATEFECHVGNIMSGVAFKADFVRIAE
jgi:hypothetical protein